MKNQKFKLVIACLAAIAISCSSCSKSADVKPGEQNTGNSGNSGNTGGTGNKHNVDARLVGTWLWTQGSNDAYFEDNGTYIGNEYGFATEYTVNADGSGSCYSHIYSILGVGSAIVVDISSTGFFETDAQGHMGYFPTSGKYESSNSGTRDLNSTELYDEAKGSGKSFLYQNLNFTTQGGRQCFSTTASDQTLDTYFKVK